MRRLLIWIGVIGAIVLATFLARANHLSAIEKSKCMRSAADLRSIATALRSYKGDHSSYPVGLSSAVLPRALVPEYIKVLALDGIAYYSDGASFVVTSRYDVALDSVCHCFYEMRDGEFVAWPKELFDEQPEGVPAI